MTYLRIHLVYLALLGFLTYQYWTKAQALNEAVGSIEQFDKLLQIDNETVDRASKMIFYDVERNVKAYNNTTNQEFLVKAKNLVSSAENINKWLENQKETFINSSKIDTSVLTNWQSIKSSVAFFSNPKIREIRDSLVHFQDILNDIPNVQALKNLQDNYTVLIPLNDNVYWERFKNKTSSDILAQLTAIQNRILLCKIPYLNYIYGNTGDKELKWDSYKVAIAPQKAVLIEGETFKADIYLASYSSNLGSDVSIMINNQEIPLKDGVSHFEKSETTVGKKIVKAIARIRNPLTGQTITSNGEFEYEVLPKCSRDCK